jgi:hypothetical protein
LLLEHRGQTLSIAPSHLDQIFDGRAFGQLHAHPGERIENFLQASLALRGRADQPGPFLAPAGDDDLLPPSAARATSSESFCLTSDILNVIESPYHLDDLSRLKEGQAVEHGPHLGLTAK